MTQKLEKLKLKRLEDIQNTFDRSKGQFHKGCDKNHLKNAT